MTEKAGYAVGAGVDFVTESDRLDRGAIMKVQRQNVHESQDGKKNDQRRGKTADKPGEFHVVLSGRDR